MPDHPPAPAPADALVAVITTVDAEVPARQMARQLLARRLAACVQIMPLQSHYRWDGMLQQAQEWQLLCKTTRQHEAALREAIAQLHSYDVPAIYSLPLQQVHAPFAEWVRTEVAPVQKDPE